MSNVPTAEEQLMIYGSSNAIEAMIEFAKLHVEAALKEQGKLAKTCIINKARVPSLEFLANAYPLENIK